MAHSATQRETLDSLLFALRDDELTQQQASELEQLVLCDADAMQHYLRVMNMCVGLRWITEDGYDGRRRPSGELPIRTSAFGDQPCPASVPVLGFLGNAFHGTVGYFSQEIPFSLLIAVAVTSLGLLIGSLIHVSRDDQISQQPSAPVAEPTGFERIEYVGRVTGTVDCKWADPNTATIRGVKVRLGRKFALASGLMEITYYTGAKVILQGPCTYEVESASGGYLALGKLTAKVEKKVESRESRVESAKQQAANHQSEIINHKSSLPTIHYPLFTVKTPTATVTDLGTEFGVEVRESGTVAHVFRGAIEMQSVARGGLNGPAVRLTENESAEVKNSAGGQGVTVRRIAADPSGYVRVEQFPKLAEELRLKHFRRWQAYSQQLRRDPSLLAYYDFQQKEGNPSVLSNVAANGDTLLDGVVESVTWSDGRMAGKHALQFNSISDYVQVNLPKKVDDLTLAAWVQVQSLDEPLIGLLMSSGWNQPGLVHWMLTGDGRIGFDAFETSGRNWVYTSDPVLDRQRFHQWTHVAVVYDHTAGAIRFYANGKPAGEMKIVTVTPLCFQKAQIGQWSGAYGFHGRIDELAIFGRALTPDEIQRMFKADKPSVVQNISSNNRADARNHTSSRSELHEPLPTNH